jgi:hypothetical protein
VRRWVPPPLSLLPLSPPSLSLSLWHRLWRVGVGGVVGRGGESGELQEGARVVGGAVLPPSRPLAASPAAWSTSVSPAACLSACTGERVRPWRERERDWGGRGLTGGPREFFRLYYHVGTSCASSRQNHSKQYRWCNSSGIKSLG